MRRLIILLSLFSVSVALADSTPVMFSLLTPVQAPSRHNDVGGFRLSLLYGDCEDFAGLDIGVASRTRGEFKGLAIGGVNIVEEDFGGLALGGVNCAAGRMTGGQLGLINWNGNDSTEWKDVTIGAQIGILNYAEDFCGFQDGLFNISGGRVAGLQDGLLNFTHDFSGVQCGFYFIFGVNIASGAVSGCQIGLVNYADTMERGCQIGIVNIIAHNGWCPILPIVNGSF